MIIEFKNGNFNEEKKEGLVLVDFYATWCGPCKMMHPIIEEIGKENPNLKIIKIDVDQHEDLAREYGIMSIPTILLFRDGNLVKKNIGFIAKDQLTQWLNH